MNEGRHTVTIQRNTIATLGKNPAVVLTCDSEHGELVEVLIWLSEKTIKNGMVRGSLKVAGFDPDTLPMSALVDQPELLAGNELPIKVEPYEGKMQARVDLNVPPPANVLADLDAALKKAHEEADEIPF